MYFALLLPPPPTPEALFFLFCVTFIQKYSFHVHQLVVLLAILDR